MDVKHEVRTFFETSSIKGLPKVFKSKVIFVRILWFIALLGGIAVAVYQTRMLLGNYLTYATSTKLEDSRGLLTNFPDLTLCKTNPVIRYELGDNKSGEIRPLTYAKFINYLSIGTGEAEKGLIKLLLRTDAYTQTIKGGIFKSKPSQGDIVVTCTLHTSQGTFIPCEDMIKKPLFLGPTKPNCVLLGQYRGNLRRDIKSLTLIAFLDDTKPSDVPSFSVRMADPPEASGVEVFISPEGNVPDYKTYIPVSPGHHARIVMQEKRHRKEPAPYSDCIEEAPTKYTQENCKNRCLQAKLTEQCGCLDQETLAGHLLHEQFEYCGSVAAALLRLGQRYLGKNLTFNEMVLVISSLQGQARAENGTTVIRNGIKRCQTLAPQLITLCEKLTGMDMFTIVREQIQCKENATLSIEQQCSSECSPMCDQTTYSQSVSTVAWPHISYHRAFYRDVISNQSFAKPFEIYSKLSKPMNISEINSILKTTDLIEKNFLKVTLKYDQKEPIVSYHDIPVSDILSIFGSASGILNLWIGFTFVTVVEVIDLVLRIGLGFLKGDRKNESPVVAFKAPVAEK